MPGHHSATRPPDSLDVKGQEVRPQNFTMEPQRPQYGVGGSRTLCRMVVNREFDRARKILEISPNLINVAHPLGWAPIHTVVLCGNPSFVKFVLGLPGLDLSKKDTSSFNKDSSKDALRHRLKELCANITATFNTRGANALHFACMRADLEVLSLVLQMPVDHDIRDDARRLPQDYFDFERVDLQVLKIYQDAYRAWYIRWRSRAKKDAAALCKAIREQDYGYCKEILEAKPRLARERHRTMMKLIQTILRNNRPSNLPENILRPPKSVQKTWTGDSSDSDEENDIRKHTPASTALHYASLLGDITAVELLLRYGADCTVVDDYNQRAGDYASISMDDKKLKKFKRLCDAMARPPAGPPQKKEEEKKCGEETEDKNKKAESPSGTASDESRPQKDNQKIAAAQKEEEIRKRHLTIEETISNQMIGQRGPIRSIASAIRLRANGWVDPDRPLVMLFLGSSGVGKTELAKRVAHYLHVHASEAKSKNKINASSFGQALVEMEREGMFTRIDMSEYQHDHTVSNLTGSPKGYVGYDDGGVLTSKLEKNPNAIVLLDEIEKAHPDVLTVFLQLFDDGRITDPLLGTIHCPGAVFIMTSNLGSEEIRSAAPELQSLVARTENEHELYHQGIREFTKRLYPILKKSFQRDEFIGRINQTVIFLPFRPTEVAEMVERELTKWKQRAADKHGIQLSWSPKVVGKLAGGYDVNYGARSVINETQTLAIQLLAEAQIRGDIGKNWLARMYINTRGDIAMGKDNPMARLLQRGCRYFL